MQEPGLLRESQQPQLASMFPVGYVISQETKAPRRVQVRIPQFHTGIPDEDLPYYRVLHPVDAMGHNGRTKQWATLPPGTEVQVALYDPRGYNGVVMGVLPNATNGYDGDDLYGHSDDFGNSFSVAKDGTMTMTDSTGATVKLGGGKLTIRVNEFDLQAGTLTINGQTVNITVTTWNHTGTDYHVTASNPQITDTSSGSGSAPTLTPPTLPQAPNVANKTDI